MLRRLLLLLLVLNLAAWAWSQGLLQDMGLGPADVREPERLERQIRPELLRLAPPPATGASAPAAPRQQLAAAPPAPTPAPVPVASPPPEDRPEPPNPAPSRAEEPAAQAQAAPEPLRCLEAGPFNEAQADILRRELASWTAGSWELLASSVPGRWMVLLRLSDAQAVRNRRAELRERGIDVDQPGAAFEPGLSLGRFSTEEAARQGRDELSRRGVSSLQVVPERRETSSHMLRLPRASDALHEQARAVVARLGVQRDWAACD